jgi:hypothetical protein
VTGTVQLRETVRVEGDGTGVQYTTVQGKLKGTRLTSYNEYSDRYRWNARRSIRFDSQPDPDTDTERRADAEMQTQTTPSESERVPSVDTIPSPSPFPELVRVVSCRGVSRRLG